MNRSIVALCILVHLAYGTLNDLEVRTTMLIDSGTRNCFIMTVNKEEYKAFRLEFMTYQNEEVLATVVDTDGILHYTKHAKNAAETISGLKAHANSDYLFCFENAMTLTDISMYVHVSILDENGNAISQQITMDNSRENLRTMGSEIKMRTNQIGLRLADALGELHHRAAVEKKDRTILESNYEYINWWGIIVTTLMCAVAFGQAYCIRCLLEEKSTVGRMLRKGPKYL